LSPEALLRALRDLEDSLGRVRSDDPNAPRTIDLDLIDYGSGGLEVAGRRLPSEDAVRHAFVAVPLAELAPTRRHATDGRTYAQIARALAPDAADMIIRRDVRLSPEGGAKVIDGDSIENAARALLVAIGEDPDRDGLTRTPERIARMYAELTVGYRQNIDDLVNDALFAVDHDEMVLVKDIEFYSLCEHHLLPFFGHAHVAYLPRGRVIGLSKIPRIVDMFARRLQVQERMTEQIADCLDEALEPAGVAVVVDGLHLCAAMRGVQKPGATMTTSAMRGSFRENAKTRAELLGHIARSSAAPF
jgi:GTP cyclohydrolase I